MHLVSKESKARHEVPACNALLCCLFASFWGHFCWEDMEVLSGQHTNECSSCKMIFYMYKSSDKYKCTVFVNTGHYTLYSIQLRKSHLSCIDLNFI